MQKKFIILLMIAITHKLMLPQSYYQILGVTRNADTEEILDAYSRKREKASTLTEIKKLEEAYQALNTASKRRNYNKMLEQQEAERLNPNYPPVFVENKNIQTSFKASSPDRPGDEWQAEIRNASPYPVYIDVENQGVVILSEYRIPAALNEQGKPSKAETDKRVVRFKNLNLNKPTYISFFGSKKSRQPLKKYEISPGKKIFGTWEGQAFRPQMGSFGKTQSGINLKGNFILTDLRRIN